ADDKKTASTQQSSKKISAPEAPSKSQQKERVSPLAKKLAKDKGIDLATLTGSGPSGRIIKADILAAESAGPSAAPAPQALASPARLEAKSISLNNMRKTIARRLVESKTTVPHFTVTSTVNMDSLIEL